MKNPIVIFLYFLLSYGLFFYVYKFTQPEVQGLKDYKDYKLLYDGWQYDEVKSPFNSRLLSTYPIYLMNKVGCVYDNPIAYTEDLNQKKILFNALLFNYVFIVFTAFLIYRVLLFQCFEEVMAFLGGSIYLVSFGTFYFALNPLTESMSIFLTGLIYFFYIKRSYWTFILLPLCIIQREYIFFIFGAIAFLDMFLLRDSKSYFIKTLALSISCFIFYFILRKTLFFTPHYAEQLDTSGFLSNLINNRFDLIPYLKQTVLIQNLLLLYFVVVAYKVINRKKISRYGLLMLSALLLQAIIVSFIATLGNSAGRYFYLNAVIIICFLFREIKPLIPKSVNLKDEAQ